MHIDHEAVNQSVDPPHARSAVQLHEELQELISENPNHAAVFLSHARRNSLSPSVGNESSPTTKIRLHERAAATLALDGDRRDVGEKPSDSALPHSEAQNEVQDLPGVVFILGRAAVPWQ